MVKMPPFARMAATLGLCAIVIIPSMLVASGDKPQYTIKEVMKRAHGKNNLVKKIALGTATAEDKKELISFYESLGKIVPPRGDADAWKKRTTELLAAAKEAVEGGKEKFPRLRKAVDCQTCHDAHKPPG